VYPLTHPFFGHQNRVQVVFGKPQYPHAQLNIEKYFFWGRVRSFQVRDSLFDSDKINGNEKKRVRTLTVPLVAARSRAFYNCGCQKSVLGLLEIDASVFSPVCTLFPTKLDFLRRLCEKQTGGGDS
jgi:hypothetical protein